MGTVTIHYGDDAYVWQDGDQVNEISSSNALSITTAQSQLYTLAVYESYAEAASVRGALLEKIEHGLGNGDVIITIEDL